MGERVEIYQAERRRQKASTARCYNPTCGEPILYELNRAAVEHRGETHYICGPCRRRYWKITEQVARYGRRFPFVEKTEMPHRTGTKIARDSVATHRLYTDVFCLLLMLKKRQELLRKEVNWMADESAKRVLQLPLKIATVLVKTVAVAGDDFTIADDEALTRIRDLLTEFDPAIFSRARKKKRKRS